MAAPSDMTTLDISGKFFMNKHLSDDSDEILRLQGVSWFIRKAIATATVYLSIRHYKDQNGVDHIDIDESLSGVPGTKDLRTLDWSEKRQKDFVFGPVVMQSKRVNPEDIELDFLRNGWLDDANEHGIIFMKDMNEPSKSGKTWTIYQAWGFGDVKGERRYIRHVHFDGPNGEKLQSRLVYDYIGPL